MHNVCSVGKVYGVYSVHIVGGVDVGGSASIVCTLNVAHIGRGVYSACSDNSASKVYTVNIRISVKAESQIRALLRSLEELPAAAIVAKFGAVPGADPLDAIATGAHSSGSALARYALQLGLDAIAGGFGVEPVEDVAKAIESPAPAAPPPVVAKSAPKAAPKLDPADLPVSPDALRADVERKTIEHADRMAQLAEGCSKRGAVWTPEYAALILTMTEMADGSPGAITAREAVAIATAAGYTNAVQARNVKPLTVGTFRNHRNRLLSVADA